MSWFKIDDQVVFHPKVVRAGNAAFGAWVRLGAYCNAQLTDGYVSEQVALLIASRRELDALITAGLLHATPGGGFLIHDYLEYQPSKSAVMREREATKRRVQRHRNGVTPGDETLPPSYPDPIPIQSEQKKPEEAFAAAPRASFDFASVYAAYPRKEGKTKGIDRLRSQVRSPEAFEQLQRAVKHFAEKHRVEGTEEQFIPHFSTWANGKWRDYVDGPHIVARMPSLGHAPVSSFAGVESGKDVAHLLRKKP